MPACESNPGLRPIEVCCVHVHYPLSSQKRESLLCPQKQRSSAPLSSACAVPHGIFASLDSSRPGIKPDLQWNGAAASQRQQLSRDTHNATLEGKAEGGPVARVHFHSLLPSQSQEFSHDFHMAK